MDDVRTRRGWLKVVLSGVSGLMTATTFVSRAESQEATSVGIRVVDKAGYDKIIAANKGKVVVVDCWATWCVPCRKAFPKTVELSKTYADRDVVVVTLCFDELEKGRAPDKAKRFLAVHDANLENLISSLDLSGEGAEAFEISDGALPHFKVYGKDGKLFKAFESGEGKEFKHEDIEAAVKAALNAKNK